MENSFFIDVASQSLFKTGEELCGDMVEIIRKPDETVVVLADGMGSGVKANILSTLTSKIICTMISEGADIDDCVETIANTLPVCQERGIAYSTFTIVQVKHSGEVYMTEFDGPAVIRVRNGIINEPKKTTRIISGKEIWECSFIAQPDDMIVAFSDGVIHAGIGKLINLGWKRSNVMEFVQRNYRQNMSARHMTRELIAVCDNLYQGEPGDDTTVATIRIINRCEARIMVGPPHDSNQDKEVVYRLMSSTGKKIACGGTTSQIVSRILEKPLFVSTDYTNKRVPPTGRIEGLDLVTEGIITLGETLHIFKQYMGVAPLVASSIDFSKKDGATQLARILIEDCSDIIFMVGRAQNPAHQNPNLPLDLNLKIRMVNDISDMLRQLGKNVTIEQY